jgi:hypothetical protein
VRQAYEQNVNPPCSRGVIGPDRHTGHFNQTDATERKLMKKLIAVLFAATFAAVSFQAVAQDKKAADTKPTAEQCKKDPKMKGCDQMKK